MLTLGCIGIILPPPLGLWPHTYWLPGINQIRVPGRFVVMAVLGLAVLAAIGFDRVSSRLSPRRRTWLAAVVSTCIIVEGAGMPIPVSPFHRQDTEVDRWLARQRAPFAIAEFPVRPSPRYQSLYMLHSMAHWQKTVHGYSGYEAPLHTELYRQLRAFPDEVSLTRLRELRVTYAVVHRELYSDEEWRLMESRFETFRDQLELGFSLGSGRVYVVR